MQLMVSMPGRVDYNNALNIQKRLLDLRQQGRIEDTLLLLEHPPVLTIGRKGASENVLIPEEILKGQNVSVYRVERGGDVTYHGPGQIVGYPILDLNMHGRGVHEYVRNIEETFIQLLKEEYGITAGRIPEYTGVWVGNEKITAIGVAVKRWVTMHGFAFNVNTNLDHFQWINPCGITDKGVTSLQRLLGQELQLDKVMSQVLSYFCRVFDFEYQLIDKQELYNLTGGDLDA